GPMIYRSTLAHDASEHDHSLAGIKEALGLEPPFAPRLLEHCNRVIPALLVVARSSSPAAQML
ncbi:MAG TPA: hypothetical protein VKA47_05720, partial [Solirubrobacterales bacterium]|nr:hypothetical protein [Solirubrobacterales bacterium]